MEKYIITVTREQLILINKATNILARLRMGKFDEMLQELKNSNNEWIFTNELLEDIETIIKPKMGLDSGNSFGIKKFEEAGKLYTIHACIRHQFWRENPNRESGTIDSRPTDFGGGLIEIEKRI